MIRKLKLKILSGIAALLLVIAFNVNISSNNNNLSDMLLSNVEALALSDVGDDCSDGIPRLDCRIWDYHIGGGNPPSCSTGGSWKCPL